MSEDKLELAFARKYRPSSLPGYIGNERPKRSILKALNSKKIPQVQMFWGITGCGKTTLARIVARELSCENRDPVKGACGVCPACVELEDYIISGDSSLLQFVRELDISKDRSIAGVLNVIEEMYLPAYGDVWRVFIFDEFQMADKVMQNALLKVTEEPPENVMIIYCTTNPEAIIDTIKNRCSLSLEIKKPKSSELCALLKFVSDTEGFDADMKGLRLISTRADHIIRNALSKLEQVYNEKGDAKFDSVLDVFEEVSDTVLFDFYRLVINKDSTGFVSLIFKIKNTVSLEVFVRSLEEFTKRGIYIINNAESEGLTKNELTSYKALFSQFSADRITYILSKLLEFKFGDIETKLLLFGYSGFANKQQSTSVEDFNAMLITTESNELEQEKKETNKNRKEKEQQQFKEGLSHAEELIKPASPSEIMNMFNAVIVQE